jgi:hypothetical protein
MSDTAAPLKGSIGPFKSPWLKLIALIKTWLYHRGNIYIFTNCLYNICKGNCCRYQTATRGCPLQYDSMNKHQNERVNSDSIQCVSIICKLLFSRLFWCTACIAYNCHWAFGLYVVLYVMPARWGYKRFYWTPRLPVDYIIAPVVYCCKYEKRTNEEREGQFLL